MTDPSLVVLAFSGGLDTSYCVPHLREQGHEVITLFVDTGGPVDADAIAARARELGAVEHVTVDGADALWETFVVPFVKGGAKYADRYPLLCSDRYVIVEEAVRLAHERGAGAVAHGCTAMGNDQVRFDHSIRCLTDLPILAPIREIQAVTDAPRSYEIEALRARGFEVAADARRYTINENLLGTTISGSEIDGYGAPGPRTRRMTAAPAAWPSAPLRATIGFERGRATTLDGAPVDGPALIGRLNAAFGAFGVGRGIYTGDTIVGLKGRIVFECPGLEVLLVAHKALEELTLTRAQNAVKPGIARTWTELVFAGQFHEPLRHDLEAFIASTQANVTGSVDVETHGGACDAVAVRAERPLVRAGATYAQHADWTAVEAEGFIRISGQSSVMGAAARQASGAAGATEETACSIAS